MEERTGKRVTAETEKKNMIINVCGRNQAIELAGQTNCKTSILSITSKEEEDVVFPDNPNILSVLRLRFNDLTEEYDEEGIPYGRPLPRAEDFDGLKAFAAGLTCELLIVHCWEGKSRSAAVAKAIHQFRGERDELCMQPDALPNPLVYELARGELGLAGAARA